VAAGFGAPRWAPISVTPESAATSSIGIFRIAGAGQQHRGIVRIHIISLTIRKKDRNWAVLDPQGQLVCLTVYKRGAVEVVRRLAA
jgi:hypothetical protein